MIEVPVYGHSELGGRGYAVIDPGSSKLLAGPFGHEQEAKREHKLNGYQGVVQLVKIVKHNHNEARR